MTKLNPMMIDYYF